MAAMECVHAESFRTIFGNIHHILLIKSEYSTYIGKNHKILRNSSQRIYNKNHNNFAFAAN